MSIKSFPQVLLFLIWSIIFTFIYSVGHDVFDASPQSQCDICSMLNGTVRTRFIDSFESDSVKAYRSKEPICERHYYIVPEVHIKNIYSEEVNCTLINHMFEVCNQILDEDGATTGRRMYFDNPPFTSFSHFYLNCMVCSDYDDSIVNPQFFINYFSESFTPKVQDKCRLDKYVDYSLVLGCYG